MRLLQKQNKISWNRKKFLICIVLVMMSGCARVQPVTEQEEDLQVLCDRNTVEWQLDSVSQVVTLRKGSNHAKALVGSDVVVIGDQKITLSAPLRRVKGVIVVPMDFKRKVIDALMTRNEYVGAVKKFKEIIVDPGHGGKDPGARSKFGTEEKTIVLDIGKRLKRDLEDKGFRVIMTRSTDDFISLERRTEIASQSKADLFVSIHANSSKSKGAKGVEIYYLRELDAVEKKEEQMRQNQKILFKQYAMNQDSPALGNIVADMMYSYKREESERLAIYLNRRIASSTSRESRGSKAAGFFVLRNTMIPAVLVEVGFLTNPSEERSLKTIEYRQKIADSLAQSIEEYTNDQQP